MSEINDKIDRDVLNIVSGEQGVSTYSIRDHLTQWAVCAYIERAREFGQVRAACQRLRKKGLIYYNAKNGWHATKN